MSNPQLTKDLAMHLRQKVMQAGIDCTDVALDIDAMEAAGILIAGADILLSMAAALRAGSLGESDPYRALNNHESYTFMINSLKEARDAR